MALEVGRHPIVIEEGIIDIEEKDDVRCCHENTLWSVSKSRICMPSDYAVSDGPKTARTGLIKKELRLFHSIASRGFPPYLRHIWRCTVCARSACRGEPVWHSPRGRFAEVSGR